MKYFKVLSNSGEVFRSSSSDNGTSYCWSNERISSDASTLRRVDVSDADEIRCFIDTANCCVLIGPPWREDYYSSNSSQLRSGFLTTNEERKECSQLRARFSSGTNVTVHSTWLRVEQERHTFSPSFHTLHFNLLMMLDQWVLARIREHS